MQVQLAAFAQDITTFASAAAYDSRPDKTWPSETLLAASVASLQGQQKGEQSSAANEAFITGLVESSATLENSLTKIQFQWARLKVVGGFFDVCIDSGLLATALTPGQIVSGNFWLSGRLILENP